jgi:hypothetical protein
MIVMGVAIAHTQSSGPTIVLEIFSGRMQQYGASVSKRCGAKIRGN